MEWWRRQPELVRDAVGGVPVVLVFVVAQQLFGAGGSGYRAVAVVLAMAGALTVRRRWPWVAFTVALAVVAVATTGLEFLVIVSYTLVVTDRRARPWVVGGLAAVAMVVGYLHYWPAVVLEDIAGDLILIAAIAVLPPVIGRMVRTSRDRTAELRARNAELVRLRDREARHAVEAERFRIARELHDVVAHHVSAMTVSARAGRHVARRDPRAAEDALAYIAEAGTETLRAMGGFVGALRGVEEGGSGDRSPQPSLEDLPQLVESFRRTGLVVHDDLEPVTTTVSAAVGLNAFRIVQEGLTNAIRHGAAERAWVRVWYADGLLHVRVDDNGRGLDDEVPPSGHGLVGVAERAGLHGGTSAFGPSPRGGCRLEAAMPVDEAPAGDRGAVASAVTP